MNSPRLCLIALAVVVFATSTGQACNIPVFRYALERWKPDASEVIIFHDGKISVFQFCVEVIS